MRPVKRILALIGVVLILSMYALTLVFALRKDAASRGMFFASIAMTVFVPILLYAFQLAAKMAKPQKSPVIDCIIFDLAGVLIRFSAVEHAKNIGLSPEGMEFLKRSILGSDVWRDLDLGLIDLEKGIGILVSRAPHLEKDIRAYMGTVFTALIPYEYTVPWLTSLKQAGYRLYALTNWPTGAWDTMRDLGNLPFEVLLDGNVQSCDVHLLKPDPEIYKSLIQKYDLTPSRCVFMDDREENVKAAQKCGLAAFHFTDLESAKKTLADLGVRA